MYYKSPTQDIYKQCMLRQACSLTASLLTRPVLLFREEAL